MAEFSKGYRQPGDIEFKNAILLTTAGQVIDVSTMIAEINIYQNLFEHYLQCDIVLVDSISLMNYIPADKENKYSGGFNGNEILVISYRNRGVEGESDTAMTFNNHMFRLYELSSRQRSNENQEIYNLSGVSVEAFISAPVKISRAYGGSSGSTISKMVNNIVDEFIYNKNAKQLHASVKDTIKYTIQKTNVYDETIGAQKLIIPNLSVDDTIDFLGKEADSDDHIPFYLFYEDAKGFNFRNLSNLVTSDPVKSYIYKISNTPRVLPKDGEEALKTDDPFKIISYNVLKQINTLENLASGMYSSVLMNLDVHKKTMYESYYDYDKSANSFKTLQEAKMQGGAVGEPVVTMITDRSGHDCQCMVFSAENHLPKRINHFLQKKEAYSAIIFNTILEVAVPGDAELNVGNTINLTFPLTTNTERDKEGSQIDTYLSGKYIITKIRHKMSGGTTGSNFITILECAKDTGII